MRTILATLTHKAGEDSHMWPSVELARLRKSIALADLLFAHGITAEDTARMTFAEWTMAARVARVNPPHSAETRQMIGTLLRKRAMLAITRESL